MFVECEEKGCPKNALYRRRKIGESQSALNPRERFPETIIPPKFQGAYPPLDPRKSTTDINEEAPH